MAQFLNVRNIQIYFHVIPLCLMVVPVLIVLCMPLKNRVIRAVHMVWPFAAGLAWIAGITAPRITIGSSNTVVAHFVAAAFVVPCLFIYFQRAYRWRMGTWRRRSLYMVFSTVFIFGNEALELLMLYFGARVNMDDTVFDIVVGYLGVGAALAAIETVRFLRTPRSPRTPVPAQ